MLWDIVNDSGQIGHLMKNKALCWNDTLKYVKLYFMKRWSTIIIVCLFLSNYTISRPVYKKIPFKKKKHT